MRRQDDGLLCGARKIATPEQRHDDCATRGQPMKHGHVPPQMVPNIRVCRPLRLIAIVPVAALSIRIGPIPTEIGSGTRWDRSDRRDRDQRTEGNTRNDGAIVGSPNPGTSKPIWPPGPAPGTPPGAAPFLNDAATT